MYPEFKFTVFGYSSSVSMYNLMIAAGIIAGIIVFEKVCERNKVPKNQMDNLMIVICASIVFGFLSAAVFDKFVHFHDIRTVMSHLFDFTGLTFAGGLTGGILMFFIFYKVVMKDFKNIGAHLNCIVPSVPLAHAFGRIGCFLGGCCFGRPTDSILGVVFPKGSLAAQTYGYGVKVIPTQVIESLFLFLLFIILCFFIKDHLFSWYLCLYGGFRFVLEFFRGDNRGLFFQNIFSPSQCLAMFMFVAGVILLHRHLKRVKTASHG